MTDFEPPVPRRVRRRRLLVRTGVGLMLTTLLVIGVVVAVSMAGNCGTGIKRRGGECVGVTDGSYVFAEPLRDVAQKIKVENDAVRGQRAVTVAVLMPMTAPKDASLSMGQIRSHLQGAYIAQRRNNDSDTNLKIRLVLANEGTHEQHWRSVIEDLVAMKDEKQPLLAVTGLGLSVDATVAGAKLLADHDMPMVGSVLSADGLNRLAEPFGGPIDGLVRVRPSNTADLRAVAQYLASTPEREQAMLVSDRNKNDFYTVGLANAFRTELRPYWEAAGSPTDPYDGTPGTVGIDNQFRIIAGRLCGGDPPNTVMYAGRATLLPDFVQQLRERNCLRDRSITVVTGSDASDLQLRLPPARRTDAPVSVVYASVDETVALSDAKLNPDWRQYARFSNVFEDHFDSADLRNGWAIMAHDAVLTAVTAIHNAAGQENALPTARDVRAMLYLLNDATRSVPGASGTFTIDSETGEALGRRLPIVELRPDGSVRVLAVYPDPTGS